MHSLNAVLQTQVLLDAQVKSTVAMQALQPRIKEIQERYKGKDQQEMQIQVGQLYKDAGVNPLAGCLPTLATLPVWIGLYRLAYFPVWHVEKLFIGAMGLPGW